MILLPSTSHSLRLTTSSAEAVDYYAAYVDLPASGISTGAADGQVTSATDTTIVAAPAASTTRKVQFVVATNVGSASNVATVSVVNGANVRRLFAATLQAGESIQYADGEGWVRFDANGNRIIRSADLLATSAFMRSPAFASANLTATRTITSNSTFAVYMGKAPRALTSVQMRARVTTAMATITWGEVALLRGVPTVGANPSLTVLGYTDVSASFNSTGQKTTTISVASGQQVAAGNDLWLAVGNQATIAASMRAGSIADDLQMCSSANLATRPSLNVGAAQTYTIDSATALLPWFAIIY